MTEQLPKSQVSAHPPAAQKNGAGGRARKFPLTLHPTGQYCKKIRGQIHYFGRDRLIAEIKTTELPAYRKKRIEDGRTPVTINNDLAVIKAMFHWGQESEILEQGPRLDAVKKIPRKKVERQHRCREGHGPLHATPDRCHDCRC